MSQEAVFLIGLVFAVVQMICNILMGISAYQWKRTEARRDQDLADLKAGQEAAQRDRSEERSSLAAQCEARHAALDGKHERESAADLERYVNVRVGIERSFREALEKFATKVDVADMRDEIREDLHKLFAGQDQMNQRLAALEGGQTQLNDRLGRLEDKG